MGVGIFVIWTVLGVWLNFRSIERIDVDVDAARVAISQLSPEERPPLPPGEDPPPPPETDPPPQTSATTGAPGSTSTTEEPTTTTTTTTGLPDIPGEQLPYDPSFSTSPPVADEAFDAYLIIGSDRRAGLGGSRADVIILALLPDDGDPPILVSIPRDLWLYNVCWDRPRRVNVSLNGCGDAATGPELLAITVADFTGIQADHFALFDFEDFKRVIDAFGGIRICVDNPVRDGERLALPAGCTTAGGDTALAWVRSRKTEELVNGEWQRMAGVNDLTRNERQQDVLLQMLGKVKSLDTLTSLVGIVESIADAVTIDEGISVTDAIGIAWDLRDVAPREIVRVKIPVENFRTQGGAAVLIPTMSFAELFAEYLPE